MQLLYIIINNVGNVKDKNGIKAANLMLIMMMMVTGRLLNYRGRQCLASTELATAEGKAIHSYVCKEGIRAGYTEPV